MNIIMISKIDISKPTGETEHFLGLARGFKKIGHNVIIIAQQLEPNNYLEFKYFTIKPATRSKIINLLLYQIHLLISLPNIIKLIKPDFIYIRTSPFFIIAHIIAKLLHKRIISEVNGLNKNEFSLIHSENKLVLFYLILIEKLSYNISNKIIAISNPLKIYIMNNFHIKDNKIISITNGCDSDSIEKNIIRKEIKTIGFIGSILPWHGLNILIQAYKIVFKKHKTLNLLILGTNKIGNNKYNIKAIKTLNRSETNKYMALFDIAVIPSIETINNIKVIVSSPIKFFNYLNRCIPILCSDIEELNSIIKNNNIGLIFNQGNVIECAEKLNKMLKLSYKERINISKRMSILAKQYDWKIIASKIIDFVYN